MNNVKYPKLKRENKRCAKLSEEQVLDVKKRYNSGESNYSIARFYNMNASSIWDLTCSPEKRTERIKRKMEYAKKKPKRSRKEYRREFDKRRRAECKEYADYRKYIGSVERFKKDGLYDEIIDRNRKYNKIYYQNNKEKCKKWRKKWLDKNPEYMSNYHRNYHINNKEKIKEKGAEWNKKNPTYQKDYYEKNREDILRQKREDYKKKKELLNN